MLRVSGKNLDIGDALRSHVQTRLRATLARFVDGDPHGHVTVTKDGVAFRTECLLHLPHGLTLQAESRAHDPHASVDQAAERIGRRLKRHHHRLRERRGAADEAAMADPEAVYTVFAAFDEDADEADGGEVGAAAPVVIAEQTQRLKPLSVSEAVVELDLTGAPALAFRHAGHGRVNVVYRRPDGHIGWIDMPRPAVA